MTCSRSFGFLGFLSRRARNARIVQASTSSPIGKVRVHGGGRRVAAKSKPPPFPGTERSHCVVDQARIDQGAVSRDPHDDFGSAQKVLRNGSDRAHRSGCRGNNDTPCLRQYASIASSAASVLVATRTWLTALARRVRFDDAAQHGDPVDVHQNLAGKPRGCHPRLNYRYYVWAHVLTSIRLRVQLPHGGTRLRLDFHGQLTPGSSGDRGCSSSIHSCAALSRRLLIRVQAGL